MTIDQPHKQESDDAEAARGGPCPCDARYPETPVPETMCTPPRRCSFDETPPNQLVPYELPGNQVEPSAAFWTEPIAGVGLPQVVPLARVLAETAPGQGGRCRLPDFPRDPGGLDAEIDELVEFQRRRDLELPSHYVSRFIQLRPPDFGTIFNIELLRPQPPLLDVTAQDRPPNPSTALPVVRTGRELARMFEVETPGLLHRHALNLLLFNRADISPTRQARIWMALDVAIYSALAACWHYKWAFDVSQPDNVQFSFRQRPYEYDRGRRLDVLFDRRLAPGGSGDLGPRACPCPSPGTPRHPAWPSGHSTYSAAASEVLCYFFPGDAGELRKLANNVGEARLWAGIHWRSDHVAGQKLGCAVAALLIEQLQRDCVPRLNGPLACNSTDRPPTAEELDTLRLRQGPCGDRIPDGPDDREDVGRF